MAGGAAPFDSMAGDKVGESSSSAKVVVANEDATREYWKREMKKPQCPLPPRQAKATSLPPLTQKSRVSLTLDKAIEHELLHGRQLDPNLDPKTIRRTISNRISAQRSRLKRTQYIFDLEKKVHDLEELVSTLTPKFEAFKEQKRILQLENDSLRTQVDIRAAESKMKEDGLDEKRREIEELKESLKKKPACSWSNPQVERPKPYSIEFYQERLMQMEMNQFIDQQLNNSTPEQQQQQQQDAWIDDEIDQYLNLDETDFRPADFDFHVSD